MATVGNYEKRFNYRTRTTDFSNDMKNNLQPLKKQLTYRCEICGILYKDKHYYDLHKKSHEQQSIAHENVVQGPSVKTGITQESSYPSNLYSNPNGYSVSAPPRGQNFTQNNYPLAQQQQSQMQNNLITTFPQTDQRLPATTNYYLPTEQVFYQPGFENQTSAPLSSGIVTTTIPFLPPNVTSDSKISNNQSSVPVANNSSMAPTAFKPSRSLPVIIKCPQCLQVLTKNDLQNHATFCSATVIPPAVNYQALQNPMKNGFDFGYLQVGLKMRYNAPAAYPGFHGNVAYHPYANPSYPAPWNNVKLQSKRLYNNPQLSENLPRFSSNGGPNMMPIQTDAPAPPPAYPFIVNSNPLQLPSNGSYNAQQISSAGIAQFPGNGYGLSNNMLANNIPVNTNMMPSSVVNERIFPLATGGMMAPQYPLSPPQYPLPPCSCKACNEYVIKEILPFMNQSSIQNKS